MLREWLAEQDNGRIADIDQLKRLLKKAWPEIPGSGDQSTWPSKINYIEGADWNPPLLTFEIPRHGALMNGGTRTSIHHWQVNVKTPSAKIERSTYKQTEPMAKPVRMKPVALEIAAIVRSGADDERIVWETDDRSRVHVVMSRIIPSGYKQTTASRKTKFIAYFEAELAANGWIAKGLNRYEKSEEARVER